MTGTSRLTAHHRLPLHLFHCFTFTLTSLLLILEGISGPGTGYWWLQVVYPQSGTWNLGCLGACQVGQKCKFGESSPLHWETVHGVLSWHIAAGCLFFVVALANYLLILFPPPPSIRGYAHWATLLVPPISLLLPVICIIVAFVVRHAISTSEDVRQIHTEGSFWLGILSLMPGLLWVGIAEYIRWLALQKPKDKDRHRERQLESEKTREPIAWDLWSLWPWGKR